MCALRYPGGKTRAIKILEKYVPSNIKKLYSPFFGGGSFELYIKNKTQIKIYANDKFEPLYNFWNCAQLDKQKLIQEINKLHPISKDMFINCKNILNDVKNETFLRAACYFAVNRSSFSGSTMSGGFSEESAQKRFTKSSINKLTNLDLTDIEFLNQDFSDFISNIPNKKFIFMDPPYYLGKNSKLYGNNGNLHENFDHVKLYDCIKNRSNWILCYNDCQYIRNLYKKFKIKTISWKYGMNSSKMSSEILIINTKIHSV